MLCPAMLAGNFISACWRGQPKPIRAHDRSGPATKHWVCVHGLARVIPRAGRSMPTCSSSRPTCRASALSRRRSSASARALSASSSARTQSRAGGALLVPKSRKEPRARCAPPPPPPHDTGSHHERAGRHSAGHEARLGRWCPVHGGPPSINIPRRHAPCRVPPSALGSPACRRAAARRPSPAAAPCRSLHAEQDTSPPPL
jgi:hypothetical protein